MNRYSKANSKYLKDHNPEEEKANMLVLMDYTVGHDRELSIWKLQMA